MSFNLKSERICFHLCTLVCFSRCLLNQTHFNWWRTKMDQKSIYFISECFLYYFLFTSFQLCFHCYLTFVIFLNWFWWLIRETILLSNVHLTIDNTSCMPIVPLFRIHLLTRQSQCAGELRNDSTLAFLAEIFGVLQPTDVTDVNISSCLSVVKLVLEAAPALRGKEHPSRWNVNWETYLTVSPVPCSLCHILLFISSWYLRASPPFSIVLYFSYVLFSSEANMYLCFLFNVYCIESSNF